MPIISDGNNQTGDELTDKHTTIGTTEHTGSYVLSGSEGAVLDVKEGLLFVTSSDKIGIGTSSPSSKLDVSGDVNFDGAAVFNEAGASKDFRVESSAMTHALFVDGSGNGVGINTDSPKYLLDIKTNNGGIRLGNTTNSGEKSSNIHFTELASSDGLNSYGFSLNYNASENAFNIKRHNNNTTGISLMNFSRAYGNVQIGDVDASRFGGTGVPKLWVNADVNDRGIIRCSQHTADSDPPQLEISKARGTMESPAAVESLDYIAQLRAMGHDGTDFQISSDLLWIASDDFTSTSRPSSLTIRTVASGTTTPAERMRITHDGKIGVGTTSPGYRLDVDGDIRVRGNDIRDNSGNKTISFDGSANVVIPNDLTASGSVKIHKNSTDVFPQLHIHEDESEYGRISFTNNTDANGSITGHSHEWTLAGKSAAQDSASNAQFNIFYGDAQGSGNGLDLFSVLGNGDGILKGTLALNCYQEDGSTSKSDPSLRVGHSHIYSKVVSGHAEVFVKDSGGNVTQISPHTPEGEWQYFSRNTKTGKVVKVNMEKMIRRLEEITGESFMEEWYEDPTE